MPTDKTPDFLIRSLDAELPDAAQQQVDVWLSDSPAARTLLAEHRAVADHVAEHGASSFRDGFADRVMEALPEKAPAAQKTHAPSASPTARTDRSATAPKRPTRSVWSAPWARAATGLAVMALIIGVALTLRFWTTTIEVPPGPPEQVILSDGSAIELSGGSSLHYAPFWGRSERRVSLQGQAFFDVSTNDRPFIVETHNARIHVHGTQFNVRAWPNAPTPETMVSLRTGRVDVRPLIEHAAPHTLAPGETAVTTRDSTYVTPVALDQITAWRSGGLAFIDQSLASVAHALQHRFDVEIELDDALPTKALTYLNPNPDSPASVIADICQTLDLQYHRTAQGYRIHP